MLLLLVLLVKRLLVAGGLFSLRRLLLLRLHQPKATKIRRHRFVNRLIMNKQLKTVKFGVVDPSQVANGRRTALFPLWQVSPGFFGCVFPGDVSFSTNTGCHSKLLIARLLLLLLLLAEL